MPDGDGGWMFERTRIPQRIRRQHDKKLGGKVKNLIRFVKEWKFNRDVPIKSFYLEIRIAEYARREAAIVYDIDLKNIFHILLSESPATIQTQDFPTMPSSLGRATQRCSGRMHYANSKMLMTGLARQWKTDRSERKKRHRALGSSV